MVNNQYINPWTKQEIQILKQKYPTQGYNIPELLKNRTKSGINSKASVLDIKWNNRLKRIKITGRLKEIFDGLMLGDGGLSAPARGKKTAILMLSQTESKKEFVDDIYRKLKEKEVMIRYTTGNKEKDHIFKGKLIHTNKNTRIITRSYVDLRNEMFRWGYINGIGKTKIPSDVSITPLTLAIFYMGDGSIVQMHKKQNYQNYRIQFSTQCFSKQSLTQFKKKVEQRYGWKLKIGLHTSKWVINIFYLQDILNFLKITKPHMINCFAYKWQLLNDV